MPMGQARTKSSGNTLGGARLFGNRPAFELSVEPIPRAADRVKWPASNETGDGTEFGAAAIAADARDDMRDPEPAGDRCERLLESTPRQGSRGSEKSYAGCYPREPKARTQRWLNRRPHLRIDGTRAEPASTQSDIA
jgi:hypothetical protein